MKDPVEILKCLERIEPDPQMPARIERMICEGARPIPRPVRFVWWPAACASVVAIAVATAVLWRPLPTDDPREHARRASLVLKELAQAPPEAARLDYELSGLDRMKLVAHDGMPEEVRAYVAEVVPRFAEIERALRSGAPVREMARSLLADTRASELMARAGSGASMKVDCDDAELADYLRGRVALFEGREAVAMEGFREFLARYPKSRFREGATYWMARAARSQGKWTDAAAGYYALIGSEWTRGDDVRDLIERLKRESSATVTVRSPRGGNTVSLPMSDVIAMLDGFDFSAVGAQMVMIMMDDDWTTVRGDLDERVLQAFRRIRTFYPEDVTVEGSVVRLRRRAERTIRDDASLRAEVECVRRAIPVLWR